MALVTEAPVLEPVIAAPQEPPSKKRLGGEQLGVAAGQMVAGVGNLVFALIAARVLDASGFAHLSVFLGLYLVLSLPATSLSAATALDPSRRNALLKRVGWASVALAGVGAAASPFLGPALDLPVPMVLVLAAALPATAPLALDRGRLYGHQRHARLITSLVAEPAVRLAVGVALAVGVGALGGAGGVVLGAYAALEVARRGSGLRARRRNRHAAGPPRAAQAAAGAVSVSASGAAWTATAFALLAVVQNQDLIFANAMLPGSKAGLYAALSTLGGAAAFATVTIPLVLLPRAVRGERHSLAVAAGLAGVLGAAAVAVGAVMPGRITDTLFGSRYGGVAHLVVPYLAAMALLGVARVLVAHRCATGAPRAVTLLLAGVVAAQAAAIVVFGTGVSSIAFTTVGATGALTAALGVERLARWAVTGGNLWGRIRRAGSDPAVRVVAAVFVFGLVIRLITFRGIWLDEATSIHQARMTFSGMISNLRNTDVHPPLYFSVLWVDVRAFGTGLLALRLPSIAAGVLIIPAAYVTARDLWDRRSGVVAAVLAAVFPIVVWYSQEIRMYSMFMLFALLAIWGQVRVLERARPGDWAIYVLASGALAWTEYFGLFQIAAQQAFFIAVIWRDRRGGGQGTRLLRGWLVATGVLLLIGAPLMPFAFHQFLVNQNAGKGFGAPSQTPLTGGHQGINVYTVLANLAWAVMGYHSAGIMAALVALWPIGILLAIFMLGRNMTRSTLVVVVTAVVPLGLLLGAGLEKRFLFDVRYMSGVVMALMLLAARLVTGSTRSRRLQVMGCVALSAVLMTALVDEQINGSNPRLYDFSGAVHAIDQRLKPGDQLVYAPGDIGLVLDYYAPKVPMRPTSHGVPSPAPGHMLFVLASKSLMNGTQPAELGRVLAHLHQIDRPVGFIEKPNVEVWMFEVPPTAAIPALPGAPAPAGPATAGPSASAGPATAGSPPAVPAATPGGTGAAR